MDAKKETSNGERYRDQDKSFVVITYTDKVIGCYFKEVFLYAVYGD